MDLNSVPFIPKDPVRRFLVALGAVFAVLGLAAGWIIGAVAGAQGAALASGVLLCLALSVVATVVAWLLMRTVLMPQFRELALHLQALSRGDFEAAPPTIQGDELFGRTTENLERLSSFLRSNARALKIASGSVRHHALSLSSSAEEMNAASREITSTVQQISRGMETQASRTSETSEVMSAMSQNVRQMAERSAAVAEASATAWEVALKGGEAVKEAVRKIGEISANAGENARTVEGLGRTSKKIGQVVQIITGIADQTNLLALNAAIEAARAGEAGRGFAVVAEEVRKLAEGSAKAAGEINKLVREIQNETDRAVARMAEGAAELKEGRAVVNSAGTALEEIIKVVRRVDELTKDIFQLTQKQQAGTEQVVKAIEEIASVAEETAAGTEEASASTEQQTASMQEMVTAARELAETAEQLGALIGRFKAEGAEVAEAQLVVFRLGAGQYAASINRVREILRPVRVTRMPRVAGFVRGLFNLRGQVLPLVDTKARLGMPTAPVAQGPAAGAAPTGREVKARVMVVEAGGESVGLMVDEVMEVLRCDEAALQAPGNVIDLPSGHFLSSVLDLDGRLILALDLDRMIEGGRRGVGRLGVAMMEKTVLVVDDAAFMRATLRDIFGRNGYTVVGEARNGAEAVDQFAALRPALVTMDIVMPELSGIEAVRRIIAMDPKARIVMCSAMGQQSLVVEAIQAGARDFVIKPFQAARVLDAVVRAMEF